MQNYNNFQKFEQIVNSCQDDGEFNSLMEYSGLTIIMTQIFNTTKCELCLGKGHYAGVCATKKRIDQAVKGMPKIQDSWRQIKLKKLLDNLQIKKVEYKPTNVTLNRVSTFQI